MSSPIIRPLAWALSVLAKAPGQEDSTVARVDEALQALRSASTPLLRNLDPQMQSAVRGGSDIA
jgi:hypothetical protein